jgi:GDP-L-fucose synthase
MYGEYDNFRPEESHVVPATIRRFLEAKISGTTHIVMWGTGAPIRDFVYAGDVASLIPWFIDEYDSSDPVNISTGTRTSIRELACLIKDLVGYEGAVRWDSAKPDGQMVKVFSVERLHALGMACPTGLKEGLRRTISWFLKHFEDKSDGIRL